jgi:hypothetical protein
MIKYCQEREMAKNGSWISPDVEMIKYCQEREKAKNGSWISP